MAREADPRDVAAGYDRVADRYAALESDSNQWPRLRWLSKLVPLLGDGSEVLDVGCGNGIPATRELAQRHNVTGVDVSKAQIERARRNVPGARLIQGDVLTLALPAETYDAIVAFYVVDHVPREMHAAVFSLMHRWIRPSGYLLFTIEPEDQPGEVRDWIGAPMFFSQYDAQRTLEIVRTAGFRIIHDARETQIEGDHEVEYLWVLAQKELPASTNE